MTTRAGVGMSHHHSPSIAGREAAKQALENAGLDKPDFIFMFASVGYNQRSLLRAVREATGDAPLCGCSGRARSTERTQTNRTFAWSSWASPRRTCGGTTG